jgi:hypothetical protein
VSAYFLDTSTVLKRYVLETGTAWVQALAARTCPGQFEHIGPQLVNAPFGIFRQPC